MQKHFNININSYKEYLEQYSPIEIEIIPEQNKYGQFIRIVGDEKYYHIYFNNNKKEVKKTFINPDDKVSKIKVIIDYQITSFNGLFMGCKCVKSINFKKFYRNNITNMSWMFFRCISLKEINFSNFDINKVTNKNYMFYGCSQELKIIAF